MVALGRRNIGTLQRILQHTSVAERSPFRAIFHFVLKACVVKDKRA